MKNVTETLGLGSFAPNFSLPAANRDAASSLTEMLLEGPVILEFLRGTWCPNCRRRIVELDQKREEIALSGAQMVFIAAEKRDGMWKPAEFLQTNPTAFPVLLDEDRAVTKAYGVYHRIGLDALHIAHPATLVIDPSGKVRYIYRGEGQTDRAPFSQALDIARRLSTKNTLGAGRYDRPLR